MRILSKSVLRAGAALALVVLAFASRTASAAVAVAHRVLLPAPAPAKHMLFKIRGPNGATVYLLGSVHLLSAEAGKLPPEVDSAFAQAKVVAFETSLDSITLRVNEMLLKARFPAGTTLRSTLSPAAIPKVDSLFRSYGLTFDQLDGFRPWFVSIVLSQMVMQKANFQAQYGVDMQLNERAKTAKKPVIGLESVDFQLNLFDSILPADQERMLTTGKGPEEAAKELAKIKDVWMTGDVATLDSLLIDSNKESPGMLDVMLTKRNLSWIPKLEEMIKGKDNALVVVGAAHLVGKQGVLELLKAKGYTIEQM